MHSFHFHFLDQGVGGWGLKHVPLLQICPSVSICPPPFIPPQKGGRVSTHVALFMRKVFHINLFHLEYYMFLRYKRANITRVSRRYVGRIKSGHTNLILMKTPMCCERDVL